MQLYAYVVSVLRGHTRMLSAHFCRSQSVRHIASANSVVVTVLYLLRALHRRIIVYRILSKIQRIRASLATALHGNKLSDCLLSRSQMLISLKDVKVASQAQ